MNRTSKRFNKHIDAFVSVFISTCGKELRERESGSGYHGIKITYIKGIVEIKIIVTIKMTSDKLVDFSLACRMEVLEFMDSLKFNDVKTIGKDTIRLAFEQVLAFVCGNVRYGGEDISAVGS